MAKFCSKCGSPVTPNSKFCLKCGTPVGVAQAQVGQRTAVPIPPQPQVMSPQTPQAPAAQYQGYTNTVYQENIPLNNVSPGIFGFTGRVTRSTYLLYGLIFAIIRNAAFGYLFFVCIAAAMKNSDAISGGGIIVSIIAIIFASVVLMSMQVRRLHDLGKSGWYVVWIWAAECILSAMTAGTGGLVVEICVFLALAFMEGQKFPNEFGYPPSY